MSKVHLIPFQVEGISSSINEIPLGIKMIKAPSLWREGNKGDNVVVAVLDTGCQTDHPDLQEQIIGGYNFTKDFNGDPGNFSDNNGHGTHVSGTIAAAENGTGVAGAAPKAKLLVLKVLTSSGEGSIEQIVSAIKYATKWKGPQGEKVRVISMSLGGPDDEPALHSAIKNAVKNNIAVVCAAGNEGDGSSTTHEYSYPGAYQEVVEVGSVNYLQRPSSFSNTNSQVDLVAPGEQVVSTYPDKQYAALSGTSMAVPHVSGAIALIIEKYEKKLNRRITEPEIFEILIRNTKSLGYPRTQEGNGMLHLKKREVIEFTPSSFNYSFTSLLGSILSEDKKGEYFMGKNKKSGDTYESLKIRGLEKEKELNSLIQQILNKKELINQASLNSVKFANTVRNRQESMEAMSTMWNFPTKRDVANVAKMQVQLEEKIDKLEGMLAQFLANGNSNGYKLSDSFPTVNQNLQKQAKKQMLQQVLQSILYQKMP